MQRFQVRSFAENSAEKEIVIFDCYCHGNYFKEMHTARNENSHEGFNFSLEIGQS
jgi:hypothetical protein